MTGSRARALAALSRQSGESRVGRVESDGTPRADAAMVLIDGKPAGVLTRQDLLTFVAAS